MQRFFFCLVICAGTLLSKPASNTGREFWVCFDQNYRESADSLPTFKHVNNTKVTQPHGYLKPEEYKLSLLPQTTDPLNLNLVVSASTQTEVHVECAKLNIDRRLQLKAGTTELIAFPEIAALCSPGIHKGAGIHVTSTADVNVVAMNHRFQTTDSYGALPIEQLGTEYILSCYDKLSNDLHAQASVVATADATTLSIDLAKGVLIQGYTGSSLQITLNKGEVFHLSPVITELGTCDLSGTRIRSSKNVAVFSGHTCAYVPAQIAAANVLVEQLHPLTQWGSRFVCQSLPGRMEYTLRIVAAEEGTEISYRYGDGIVRRTLAASEYLDIPRMRGNVVLNSSKSIQVMQFSQGYRTGDSVGDPCMITVRPIERYERSYLVESGGLQKALGSLADDSWKHMVLLCVPTKDIASLTLNGRSVDASLFEKTDGEYSVAGLQLQLSEGVAAFSCSSPFSLLQYGYGMKEASFDSYGHGW